MPGRVIICSAAACLVSCMGWPAYHNLPAASLMQQCITLCPWQRHDLSALPAPTLTACKLSGTRMYYPHFVASSRPYMVPGTLHMQLLQSL